MYVFTLLQQFGFIGLIVFLLSIVISISFHEFAHAWTAYKLGDDTPWHMGRVTLNPAAHLDPIGSLLFLFIGFGYGKPVLYNPMRLSRKFDELLVALAGPASNVLLAIFLNLILAIQSWTGVQLILPSFLELAVYLNLLLASFNLLPIPPLDGSSIIAYFWPEYRSIGGGQIGFILLAVILLAPNLLSRIIEPIANILSHVATLFGFLS